MKIEFSSDQIEVISDIFTNLSAAFFATLIAFPGIFGVYSTKDVLSLLLFHLPLAIVSMVDAIKLKRYI